MAISDKIRLRESVKNTIRGTYPLMAAKVARMGEIAPVDDMVQVFGEEAVGLAIQERILFETAIIKRTAAGVTTPDSPIRVVHCGKYKGDRPGWLDA